MYSTNKNCCCFVSALKRTLLLAFPRERVQNCTFSENFGKIPVTLDRLEASAVVCLLTADDNSVASQFVRIRPSTFLIKTHSLDSIWSNISSKSACLWISVELCCLVQLSLNCCNISCIRIRSQGATARPHAIVFHPERPVEDSIYDWINHSTYGN